jgi:hypothetical protein
MIEKYSMNHKDQKAYEIAIFKKFISSPDCLYKINIDTIRNVNPPGPDIYLEMQNSKKLYFELTQCVYEPIAKQTGDILKSQRKDKDLTELRKGLAIDEKSLFKTSMEKFEEKYPADAPIELLSYFEQQAPPLGDALWRYGYFVKEKIGKSPFRRVWVYDVFHNKVMFNFPEI